MMSKLKIIQAIAAVCILGLSACNLIPPRNISRAEKISPEEVKNGIRVLDVYKENLTSEFDPILSGFQGATRYSIELTLGEEINQYSGHLQAAYTNQENISLDKIIFMLIPNSGGDYLKVKNIQVDSQPVSSAIKFQNSVLEIRLAEPLQPGESVEISMDYFAAVPQEMGGNYGLFIYQEEILALDAFFPLIPVFDDEGWNVQDPPRNADLIFTDAAFFEVQVDAPKDLVLVASGNAVDSQLVNDRQVITFAGGPQRDFYLAASPRFESVSQQVGDTKITSYYPKEFNQSGELVLETAAKALQVFSKRYGLYPYTELDLVSTPMRAGGMEYSTAAAMAVNLYGSGNSASGLSNAAFLEFAVAHEVAHQWFFNQVMNDQIDEPWLDEGMAQYLTYIYYLDTYGADASEEVRAGFERYWSAEEKQPIPIGKPAGDYDGRQYAAIIYGRAPLFILELEKKMSPEVFTLFLADYVEKFRWETVTTAQFRSLAEETCGCNLTSLFADWWEFE